MYTIDYVSHYPTYNKVYTLFDMDAHIEGELINAVTIQNGSAVMTSGQGALTRFFVDSPVLKMGDNIAGSLDFTIGPDHPNFDKVTHYANEVRVYEDGDEIWSGRIMSIKEDVYGRKQCTCEGALSYFNDSVEPCRVFENVNLKHLIWFFLNEHNNQMNVYNNHKKFELGRIKWSDPYQGELIIDDDDPEAYQGDDYPINFETDYISTYECFNKLKEEFPGNHMIITRNPSTGNLVFNFVNQYKLSDVTDSETEVIVGEDTSDGLEDNVIYFGENLLDYARNFDVAEFVTSILPKGKSLDDESVVTSHVVAALDNSHSIEYTAIQKNIGGYNNVTQYRKSADQTILRRFGFLTKVVDFDKVENATELTNMANNYLRNLQFEDMGLELTAIDLSYLDTNIRKLHLFDEVRVVSEMHGLDKTFRVTEVEIPLDQPELTKFKMGGKSVYNISQIVQAGKVY